MDRKLQETRVKISTVWAAELLENKMARWKPHLVGHKVRGTHCQVQCPGLLEPSSQPRGVVGAAGLGEGACAAMCLPGVGRAEVESLESLQIMKMAVDVFSSLTFPAI